MPITTKDIRKEGRHENPIQGDIVQGAFQIHLSVSGFNFSNNMPVPQVTVNIRETEHDTTFEIS